MTRRTEQKAADVIRQFQEEQKAAQKAALLSLDEQKIREFHKRCNPHSELPKHPDAFWGAVHKCITGLTNLPIEFRRKSKAWLDSRGFKSYDDGDL